MNRFRSWCIVAFVLGIIWCIILISLVCYVPLMTMDEGEDVVRVINRLGMNQSESYSNGDNYCSYDELIRHSRIGHNNISNLSHVIYSNYQCPNEFQRLEFYKQMAQCTDTYIHNALKYEIHLRDNDCKVMDIFNGESFLKLLINHTLYIIGDSLTEQFFTTLVCNLNLERFNYTLHSEHNNQECKDLLAQARKKKLSSSYTSQHESRNSCDILDVSIYLHDEYHSNFRIVYRRNNALMAYLLRMEIKLQYSSLIWTDFYTMYWRMMLLDSMKNDSNRKILYFNTGAHWPSILQKHNFVTRSWNETYLLRYTVHRFLSMFKPLMEQHTLKIIYGTTQTGHDNCFGGNEKESMAYGWNYFPLYDDIIIQEMHKVLDESKVFNNSIWLHSMREGHRPPDDCLHYCQPGPQYWNSVLFYHIIRDITATSYV
eukprot:41768_1